MHQNKNFMYLYRMRNSILYEKNHKNITKYLKINNIYIGSLIM